MFENAQTLPLKNLKTRISIPPESSSRTSSPISQANNLKDRDRMPDAKLFLIDAHALCYRAFFAIKGLTTSRGQPTNAVYGFLNTLRKILREYNPEYMAVCFDVKGKTNRHTQFAQYKIHRPVMPDELTSQIG